MRCQARLDPPCKSDFTPGPSPPVRSEIIYDLYYLWSGCTVLTGPLFSLLSRSRTHFITSLYVLAVRYLFDLGPTCTCTIHASALTLHTTTCGDQCLQHVVSYKVTKLAAPLKMATIADVRESIPSLPDEPHHPKRFDFPKRSFGKT